MQIVSIAWNVKSCFLGNKTNNDFFFSVFVVCWISPDSGNSIPASTKCRVFEVFEQDILSSYLSIGFYPGRRCLECPWGHVTILCEDAFPPMLGFYVRLLYSLNKLRSWFCISNVEKTKTEHFTWKRKFWRLLYKQLKIMLLIYIPEENNITIFICTLVNAG